MQSTPNRKPHDAITLWIKGRGPEWTPDLQILLDRSLQRASERFPQAIRSIAASLEDVNGPRGGVDKRCAITLTLTGNRKVAVNAYSSNAAAAIIHAARRARNGLIRTMLGTRDRLRDSRRETGP